MNCKQAEELLPLYAGRDLDNKRARRVTEHLQACASCARVADEYGEALQLTQQFASPVFSEDTYAQLRRRVLREIVNVTPSTAPPQLFFDWLRPRMTWAVASVALVALAVFAVYFVASRQPGRQHVAVDHRTSHIVDKDTPPVNRGEKQPPKKSGGEGSRPIRVPARKFDRRPVIAAKLNNPVASRPTPDAVEPNSVPADDATSPERTLRMEIQTHDPNIRIIWFVQPDAKPTIPNSKGT